MCRRVFRNPVYRGTFTAGRDRKCLYKNEKRHIADKDEWIVIENHHEAIISAEEYEGILKRKQKSYANNLKYPNLLKGKIKCQKCGSAMSLHHAKSEKARYFCRRKNVYGLQACDCKNILEDKVLDSVLQVAKEEMQALLDLDILLEKINHTKATNRHIKTMNDNIQKTKQEIERVVSLKSSAYEDLSEGLIDEKEYRVLAEEYSDRLDSLKSCLDEYEQTLSEFNISSLDKDGLRELIAKYKRKRILSKDMVDDLVDMVFVNDGELEIRLKFDDPMKEIQRQIDERRAWSDEA